MSVQIQEERIHQVSDQSMGQVGKKKLLDFIRCSLDLQSLFSVFRFLVLFVRFEFCSGRVRYRETTETRARREKTQQGQKKKKKKTTAQDANSKEKKKSRHSRMDS